MTDDSRKWDVVRAEQLRATLTAQEIAALRVRSDADPTSLSLDEVGVLFLETRDHIRSIEAAARKKQGGDNEPG
jgi:DNA-directed RNA polymerase sigma subunit (sigma70/sigma32)